MKFAKNLLFGILSFSTFITAQQHTPGNTAIVFDIDDTAIVIKNKLVLKAKAVGIGLSFNLFKTYEYIQALRRMKNRFTKINGNKVLLDDNGERIEGATYQLLFNGMKDETLRPYVLAILSMANKSRQFINSMEKLIYYLQQKGFEINYATNKDHIAYEQVVDSLKKLGQFPTHVIVAQPDRYKRLFERLDQEKENLPDSYRKLLEKAKNIKPTGKIYHAPATKPAAEYFKTVNSVIKKPKKIFIDDKEENVGAAKAAGMEGIHFINTGQLVNELIKLGILSEETDKVFLEELRNASIMGKVNEKAKKFWNYMLISFFQHNKKTA